MRLRVGGLSIGAVARRTGIPVTTLRFYEREIPGLFPIRKTAGGHRRYDERDVARFGTVRSLTADGLPLAEIRRVLRARGENEAVAEALDRLAAAQREAGQAVAELLSRVAALEERLAAFERPRRGWFRGNPRGEKPRE